MAETLRQQRNAPQAGANAAEFSVSDLAGAIKRSLEDGFGYVRVRGEISGYRGPHSSGHCYFSLKDDKAKIDAVVWRGSWGKLKFKPEEGMEVLAQGRITTYPNSSKYQIVIEAMEPAGVGALMALLEERKRKLGAEGLFEDARKKRLPFLPAVVGIVTSPTGAVIRDMLHGFTERFPTRVLVWPVRVQGETSAAEVAGAIRGFNALTPGGAIPRPDVLIVARGGGSLEDLWGFNEEAVVRAAAESEIPLISAVGHETDWTLIDLAADARAPTPTKAAEWAVPKHSDLVHQVGEGGIRLQVAISRALEGLRTHLRAAARGLPRLVDLLALPRQRFDAVERRLGRALLANTHQHKTRLTRVGARLQPRLLEVRLERAGERLARTQQRAAQALERGTGNRRSRFERVGGRLNVRVIANIVEARRAGLAGVGKLLGTLSYQSVLERGFALVRDGEGRTIRRASGVTAGALLEIEFADGKRAATATPGEPPEGTSSRSADAAGPPEPEARAPAGSGLATGAVRARPPRRSDGGQGSLF